MMRVLNIYLVTILLFSGYHVNAQGTSAIIDSLEILLKKSEGKEKVDLLNSLSREYRNVSYKSALGYSSQAYDLAAELNYFEGMSDAANRTGNIYFFLRDTTRALEQYRKSLELAQAIGSEKRKGIIYHNLGVLYSNLNEFETAIQYYKQGLEAKIKDGDKALMSSSLSNLGWALFRSGEYTKAIEYYKQFTKLREELNDSLTMADGYRNIGVTFLKMGDYNKSVSNLQKAYNIYETISDSLGMIQSFFNIGEALLQNNSLEGARVHLEMARDFAERVNNNELMRDILRELSLLNEKEKNFKEAWILHTRFSSLKDSLDRVESARLLEELKIIYETENTANQGQILEMEHDIKTAQIRREKNFRTYLIISVLLLMVIAGIILSRLYIKQRLNKKLKEKIKTLQYTHDKLKRSEENLRNMNITKDRFFGIIAHDLKNPFNALMGFSDMLSENLDELTGEEISKYVEIIHNSASNLYRLLENLLLWSATQTGNISFAPENFDLRVLAQKEISLQKNALLKKKIAVVNKIAPGINVYADVELISKTFNNLLDNAIKFSPEGGTITLSAVALQSYAEISIADTGQGMTEEQIQHLFRLENKQSQASEQRGTGLGLILSKHFVERNSGFIDVISTPNRGTTFIFSIPLAEKAKKPEKI